MAASYSDQQFLAGDATFQNRVRQSLIAAVVQIQSESGDTVVYHRERTTFCVQIMAQPDNYKVIFSQAVATNASVIGDATQAGTVVLSSSNVAAQAALVTDAHIDAAISGQFNAFFRRPAS